MPAESVRLIMLDDFYIYVDDTASEVAQDFRGLFQMGVGSTHIVRTVLL